MMGLRIYQSVVADNERLRAELEAAKAERDNAYKSIDANWVSHQALVAKDAEIEQWKTRCLHESAVSFQRWEHLTEQLAAKDAELEAAKSEIEWYRR
jgi:hypothetical protein